MGYEILRAVVMKSCIFCDTTMCGSSPLQVNQSFRGTSFAYSLLQVNFLLGLLFNPKD
jgi:hypothetical protein